MTYEELKSRLVRVESALQTISNNSKISKEERTSLAQKFSVLKESIQKQIAVLNEAVEFDNEKDAAEFAEDNPEVPVKITKEASDAPEDIEFDRTKMPIIATAVGKALAKALIKLGDEIARMKAHRLDVNSFDVLVVYKGEGDEDDFSFHIENGNLHIADFSYNEKLVEVGIKPSGDPVINEFNLVEALINHFRNLEKIRSTNEAMDTPMPDTTTMSVKDLQKVYSLIVDKMLELNDLRKKKGLDHMYMGGTEPGKHSVRDHLISLTRKKKQVAGAIEDKVAGIGKGQELTNEGDLAYVADEDYQTIRDLIQFIDDHADNFEKNPQMEPALKFLKRLLREDTTLNEMVRHSVIAKHDGYQLVKKSNTPELTIAKKGKSVGNFKTSGNHKDDIEQFQKMIKSGKINEGTDLYDGDKFSMKRFAGPNGIALQITAPKLKGGGYEYIQIDGDTVKEFARAAVHVAQEFHDIDRQFPVNEFFSNYYKEGNINESLKRAVDDIPGLSPEEKMSLVQAANRIARANFDEKGNKVMFHDANTIQQMGARAKRASDRAGISSNTPYMNSLEYFEKQQFSNVKKYIDNRLTVARLGLKHVMTGPYTKKEIAVYKPLLQDQVAMLMHLQDMDDASLENLFKKNPSSDPQWKEIFRRFPEGNNPSILRFRSKTDIASIKSKLAQYTADDAIDGELGNALANISNSDDFEKLVQAVEKLKAQRKPGTSPQDARDLDMMDRRRRELRAYKQEYMPID